jgi:glycoprotein-N-acetylgalactosamine 3-beta-galactosyltransferase
LVPRGYHSGGASYVLSREALKRFYQAHQIPNNTFCQQKEGIEDVEIAKCLREQGVYMGKSLDEYNRELFHPLPFGDHFSGSYPDWLKSYAENPIQTVSDSYSISNNHIVSIV